MSLSLDLRFCVEIKQPLCSLSVYLSVCLSLCLPTCKRPGAVSRRCRPSRLEPTSALLWIFNQSIKALKTFPVGFSNCLIPSRPVLLAAPCVAECNLTHSLFTVLLIHYYVDCQSSGELSLPVKTFKYINTKHTQEASSRLETTTSTSSSVIGESTTMSTTTRRPSPLVDWC